MLASHTYSVPGKKIVASLVPQTNLAEVQTLLLETKEAHDLILKLGRPSFEGLAEMDPILMRLRIHASLESMELLLVRDLLAVSRRLREYVTNPSGREPLPHNSIASMLETLHVLKHLESEIQNCINGPDEIADGASHELRTIRIQIARNMESVRSKLQEFIRSERYKKILQEPLVTIRNGRHVIPVKQEHRGLIKGMIHDSSASGSTLFIEPMEVVELNNRINSLFAEEKEEILRILKRLSDECREYLQELEENYRILSHLDFVFAKAAFAFQMDCTFPKMNETGIIRFHQGIHPLLNRSTAVPIDFSIGEGYKTLVITGPNTGGKTVCLKTVGLFTLMVQCGLAIPAGEGSIMSVFDGIFADIGDEQSIEQNLSTFSSHMTNIISIIRDVNTGSLVLLDEIGAGTDPSEGSSLAQAILEYLRESGCTTVATTHYSEIKHYASLRDDVENASCEFDVKTLRPTFRLLIGIPGKSNALYIARRLGLRQEIVERAKSYIQRDQKEYEDILLSMEKDRQRMEKDKLQIQKHEKELKQLIAEAKTQRDSLNKERDKILEKAQNDAKDIITKASSRSQWILDEVQKLRKEGLMVGNTKDEAQFRTKVRETESMLWAEPEDPRKLTKDITAHTNHVFKPGDSVKILSMNKKATVLSASNTLQTIQVQVGVLKITVPYYDLIPDKEIQEQTYMPAVNVPAAEFQLELDIRGHTVDEASPKVDRFLEDAFTSKITKVTIIHGKGTGALRQGIQEILCSHSLVHSFRLGTYGEGDAGVTVVKLNSEVKKKKG